MNTGKPEPRRASGVSRSSGPFWYIVVAAAWIAFCYAVVLAAPLDHLVGPPPKPERPLVFLAQVEFPGWIDRIYDPGGPAWTGDGIHTYRRFNHANASDYAEKALARGQWVMFTLTDDLLGYDPARPGRIAPGPKYAPMAASAMRLKIARRFWGWHCEGKWQYDVAAANLVLDMVTPAWAIWYRNDMIDPTGRATRKARLWYTTRRPEPDPGPGVDVTTPDGARTWYRARPEVRPWIISLYPIGNILGSVAQGNRTDLWVGISGVPADNPTDKLDRGHVRPGWLESVYTQNRVDRIWTDLVIGEWAGADALVVYTFSTVFDDGDPATSNWSTIADQYPRLWKETNEAVTAFKTRTVPKTWKAPDQRWLTFDQTPKPKP